MKRPLLLTLFLLSFSAIFGQSFNKVYEKQNNEGLFNFVKEEKGSYYLAHSGEYLIMNSPGQFGIVDGNTGELITSGKHLEKDKGAQLISNIMYGKTPGFMADGEALKESSGFYVFQDEKVVVFLDWTLDKNIIKAFDLKTGKKIWETNRYRYTPEKNDQMASVLATIAFNKAVGGEIVRSGTTPSGAYYEIETDLYQQSVGSKDAQAFITPMEGTGNFLLKVQKKHVCLDIKTGEEKWMYDGYPINIAENYMIKDNKEMVLVNFNPRYFGKSENLIIKLDTKTGEELVRIKPMTNFVENRTYVTENRLVTDYYGIEMYDLNTGKRILSNIDERIIKARNTMAALGDENNSGVLSYPSFVENGILYTGTSRIGRQIHPMKAGGRNITVYAYDTETGKEIWSTQKPEHKSQMVDLTDKYLILKYQKGLNKHVFYGMDKETGKITGESDKIKQYLLRNGAGYIVSGNSVFISGKRGIYVYNLNTWKEVSELDTKKADIGKLQAMSLMKNGLFVVGDDGVGFYDEKGKHLKSLIVEDIEGTVWSDKLLMAFTGDEIIAVDLEDMIRLDNLTRKEAVLYSVNLKHWLLEGNQIMTKYKLQN